MRYSAKGSRFPLSSAHTISGARKAEPSPARKRGPKIQPQSNEAALFYYTWPNSSLGNAHLNYVVSDSKWEESAAYYLDTHRRVQAFGENQFVRGPVRPGRGPPYPCTNRVIQTRGPRECLVIDGVTDRRRHLPKE